jgi:hypothetical protein
MKWKRTYTPLFTYWFSSTSSIILMKTKATRICNQFRTLKKAYNIHHTVLDTTAKCRLLHRRTFIVMRIHLLPATTDSSLFCGISQNTHIVINKKDSCDQDIFSTVLTSNETYLRTTRLINFKTQTTRTELPSKTKQL